MGNKTKDVSEKAKGTIRYLRRAKERGKGSTEKSMFIHVVNKCLGDKPS